MMSFIHDHPDVVATIAYIAVGGIGALLSESHNSGIASLGRALEALAFDARKLAGKP